MARGLPRLGIGFAAALLLLAAPQRAAPSAVAVSVGSGTMTVADVERRLGNVPPFQLASFGATPDEIRRNYVNRVLVPELLLAEEARRLEIDKEPGTGDRLREVLRQAMEAELRETVEKEDPITPAEVAKYFADNRHRFETPPRLRLWRIQVADEAQARKIIEQARGPDGPTRWAELARQTSLDKATAMRAGDLGFVRADGTTDVPRVRADPGLYKAAEKLKDGELVSEPIREGNHWSVVWRRGSLPQLKRTLEQEERSIRTILGRTKLDRQRQALIEGLRKQHLRDVDDSLLESLKISSFGEIGTPGRPGVIPRHRARARPAPSAGDQGLR